MALSLSPPVRITAPEQLRVFDGFRCGKEPYQEALADWIIKDAPKALKEKTRIWAYATTDKAVFGYGSLGKTRWWLTKEDREEAAQDKKVRVQIIPALAVHEDFQGQKLSYYIVRHLIQEAMVLIDQVSPLLGLFVHEKNDAAIHVYKTVGFRFIDHSYVDEAGLNKAMIYELAAQSAPPPTKGASPSEQLKGPPTPQCPSDSASA